MKTQISFFILFILVSITRCCFFAIQFIDVSVCASCAVLRPNKPLTGAACGPLKTSHVPLNSKPII